MLRYTLKRFLLMIVTLFVIATLTFFMMKLIPGSPLKNREKLSAEQQERIEEQYGLNDPLVVQYANYMNNLVHGDMGESFQFAGREVTQVIGDSVWASARLGFQALVFGTIVGLILGIIAAIKHNTWADYLTTVIAVIGVSVPSFVFASILQLLFAVELDWLPVAGWPSAPFTEFDKTILPTLALSVFVISTTARFMRTELLEVLGSDYILLARAKGVSRWNVIFKHGVRNALIPVITILGPLAVNIMTGSLVIERIFAIPGLGEQFVTSVTTNDYSVVMGLAIFYSLIFVIIIFVIDMLYGIIDPRIRVAGGDKS